MSRILLVEDSLEYQLILSRALGAGDMKLIQATTRAEAIAKLSEGFPDLVIMDLGLPDGDGFEVLEDLRGAGLPLNVPVFFLTSETDLSAKITAFNLGADDYLVKPINPIELRARVEMRLRKVSSATSDHIRCGSLSIDLKLMRVSLQDNNGPQDVSLTTKEYKILSFLAQNPDQTFTREQIVESIWGKGVFILDRTVDSHIYGLRKKLGFAGQYITSVTGLGYRFTSQPVQASA